MQKNPIHAEVFGLISAGSIRLQFVFLCLDNLATFIVAAFQANSVEQSGLSGNGINVEWATGQFVMGAPLISPRLRYFSFRMCHVISEYFSSQVYLSIF
jgi:hypothetical protein